MKIQNGIKIISKNKKKFRLEVLIDKKWYKFKNWLSFFNFAAKNKKNCKKAGRAEIFVNLDDIENYDKKEDYS